MSEQLHHKKEILLVEDLAEFSTTITRWLTDEGYCVTLATSYAEAVAQLMAQRYHLAILDIRLKESDALNEDGLKLLQEIERLGLKEVMPCIVLTAYPNVENMLEALNWQVARYIQKKPRYREELITVVHTLFMERVLINFALEYDLFTPAKIIEIANDVNYVDTLKPKTEILVDQVQDLFGKLFAKAQRLFVMKLRPGLTGAAVTRVQPTWPQGIGPAYVAKISRKEKVRIEQLNYENHVAHFLPPNMTTQVDVAYTKDLGALLYRFADGQFRKLTEFDDYYKHHSAKAVAQSIHNLFYNTGQYWYKNDMVRRLADLPQLYYDAFTLTEAKLVQRTQEIVPDFAPAAPTLFLPDAKVEIVNPLFWLTEKREECAMPVFQCITHGDLTGRNIMVNEEGQCWLIDFYRTRPSHILRDFVIFESDIKYRLLTDKVTVPQFLTLERALLTDKKELSGADLPPALVKVYQVIKALHKTAFELLRDANGQNDDTRKEYLISLLMATLNVVRLRHITPPRKQQALLAAALLCNELDRLSGYTVEDD